MTVDHPYENLTGGRWLRGNLHAHSTRSDGRLDPQVVIDQYAARGYEFLMLSDHDVYTSASDYSKLDAKGLVLIPGNEVSARGEHLLHVNATCRVEPHDDRQLVLNEIEKCGGFAVINHPNWSVNDPELAWTHVTQKKLCTWKGFKGIEIYNGVIGPLQGSQYALDRWDRLLTSGCRAWGFANDDSHDMDQIALGWNMVYTNDRTVSGIVDALSRGRFYASTGVVISRIEVKDGVIRLETENADRIVATAVGQRRFSVVDSNKIEVKIPEKERYVRFECWGRGEQFAWTQPFFLS